MPIKGRSDISRLPRIGKIHLGVKAKSGKTGGEYPSAVDYFVVKPDESTSETAASAFHETYGDQPKELTIMLASNDPEQFFPQYLSSYRRVGDRYELFCKGDGEIAMRADGSGGRVQIPCLHQECALYQQGKCKELGMLQFFLRDVKGLGVWQIDTTSFYSTVNLNGSIRTIMALTGGKIAMIPLKLRLIPKVVNPEGYPKTVYVLTLGEDEMKISDFIANPQWMTAIAPSVEPINDHEMPDDLFNQKNLVTEEDINQSQPQPKHVTLEPDVSEMFEDDTRGELGAVCMAPQFKKIQGNNLALVQIESLDGVIVEGVTDDSSLVEIAQTLKEGSTVRFKILQSQRFPNRKELIDLAVVS